MKILVTIDPDQIRDPRFWEMDGHDLYDHMVKGFGTLIFVSEYGDEVINLYGAYDVEKIVED